MITADFFRFIHIFRIFTLSFLAAAMLVAPATFFSLKADPFAISGVVIAAKAKDATLAKKIAIEKGQKEAFRRLIRRLTRPADAQYLPKVKEDGIEPLVAGFSLLDEKPSPGSYKATMTVRFISANVRQYLDAYGVPMVDVTATPVLLIPLFSQGGQTLMGPGNPWHDAWEEADLQNTLVPILLPVGDASDLSISPAALGEGRESDMEMLKERYSVSGVLVAVASQDARGALRVTLRGNAPSGRVDFDKTYNGKSAGEAMRLAVRGSIERLENRWKNASVSGAGGAGETLAVSVPFRGLDEWIIIRKRLLAMPGVSKMDIRAMTAKGAHIILTYSGGVEQLSREMMQRNMELTDLGEFWELRAF